MKRLTILIVILGVLIFALWQFRPTKQVLVAIATTPNYINEEGNILKDRVVLPEGFKRIDYTQGSFQEYIRNYKLKPFGSKVINFDGSYYFNQIGHYGVLDIDVPKNGLQQCADALIRIRSEYLWQKNRKDEIGFNFTSGHYCSWKAYAEGYRPKIDGNKVSFHKTAQADASKNNFYKYLNLIYTYSGTISLFHELPKVNDISKLEIGDMLIIGGSPGHVVMIGDIIENADGERLFILFQGNTPAQSVHLLKNLDNSSISPWYELAIEEQISVPGYTFYDAKYVRFK